MEEQTAYTELDRRTSAAAGREDVGGDRRIGAERFTTKTRRTQSQDKANETAPSHATDASHGCFCFPASYLYPHSLVPKLRLGTQFEKLCFAPVYGLEAELLDLRCQAELGNEVLKAAPPRWANLFYSSS
jgi:hypothetical protein